MEKKGNRLEQGDERGWKEKGKLDKELVTRRRGDKDPGNWRKFNWRGVWSLLEVMGETRIRHSGNLGTSTLEEILSLK